MLNVKDNQTPLVSQILLFGSYGPNTVDSMIIHDRTIEEAGLSHTKFVIEQLVVVGWMSLTSDGRYITTQEGEAFLKH